MFKKTLYLCLIIFTFAIVICIMPRTHKCLHCNQACFSEPNIAFWISGDPSCIHDHCLKEWDGFDWRIPMEWPHGIYIE